MTKLVSLIRGFSANPETEQYYDVGEEIGNGVDRIRYEGLAMTQYSRNELEHYKQGVGNRPYPRNSLTRTAPISIK
jgi:hypothetical protein